MRRVFASILFILLHFEVSSCSVGVLHDDVQVMDEGFTFNPTSEYIAIIGDIQYLTNNNYCNIYRHSVDWLLAQRRKGMRINCVLQTGDLTQNNTPIQWTCFHENTKELADVIPVYPMIGDHDYTWDGIYINDRKQTLFNDYVNFPLSKNNIIAQFENGRMENIIVDNVIHGQHIFFLILEFGPRKEVVEWANSYVKSYPETSFVLMTHEYLEKGGGRRTTGLKSAARLRNTTYSTPEELWNYLIKCNDNIRCVLCGHVGSLYALTTEANDYGRDISQIQHNIQGEQYRFDNWLMLWEFPEFGDSVNVFIYNTSTSQYYKSKPLFTFHCLDNSVKTKVSYSHKNHVQRSIKQIYTIDGHASNYVYRGVNVIREGGRTRIFPWQLPTDHT